MILDGILKTLVQCFTVSQTIKEILLSVTRKESQRKERLLHLNHCALQTRTLKVLMGWRRFRRGQGRDQGVSEIAGRL